jgi:predicted RecA/RadA family phage recombinase
MRNYIAPGERVVIAAPAATIAGTGVLQGSMFGMAQNDAASGAELVLVLTGIFSGAKAASQAWTVGVPVFWDNTNRVFTTTASGNTRIGVAVEAVGSGAGETTGIVRLNGSF